MLEDMELLIVNAARDVAEQGGQVLATELGRDTDLFGEKGIFDSLGLVSLLVAVEEGIWDRFGREVSLADEKALSRKRSPFRSIGTLADYAHELIGQPQP